MRSVKFRRPPLATEAIRFPQSREKEKPCSSQGRLWVTKLGAFWLADGVLVHHTDHKGTSITHSILVLPLKTYILYIVVAAES